MSAEEKGKKGEVRAMRWYTVRGRKVRNGRKGNSKVECLREKKRDKRD